MILLRSSIRDLQHYTGMIIEDEDSTEKEKEELLDFVKNNNEIAHCNRVQMTKISAPKGNSNISIYLFVPESLDEFAKDVTLQNRITGEKYELTDEGAAISEKTARPVESEGGRHDHIGKGRKKIYSKGGSSYRKLYEPLSLYDTSCL